MWGGGGGGEERESVRVCVGGGGEEGEGEEEGEREREREHVRSRYQKCTHLIFSLSSTSLQHQLLKANGYLHVTSLPCIAWTVREDHGVISSQ